MAIVMTIFLCESRDSRLVRNVRAPFTSALVIVLIAVSAAFGQQRQETILPNLDRLVSASWAYGLPGGMLHHTAFHQGVTTRYLLLKAANRSKEIANYLNLSQQQLETIRQLRPATMNAGEGTDLNAQPDEQSIDPNYFDFLEERQLIILDVLALRCDGFPALMRKSLAEQLELTDTTRQKVAKAVRDIREDIVLPRFRWEFAAKLPDDIKQRDMEFSGKISTYANIKIVLVLAEEERHRLIDFIKETELPYEILQSLDDLMQYPAGVQSLRIFDVEAK